MYKPLTFPSLKGPWVLTEDIYNELCEDFPEMDVMACVLNARAWARANEKKANVRKFLANWLIRARKNGECLKIVAAPVMPRFLGTDDDIRAKERLWRKHGGSKAAIDDMWQRERDRYRREATGDVVAVGDLLRFPEVGK